VFALVETIVFIVLLFIAFIYVWRRGALEWK
jgi:NADH-quinone oxidoreductase subunit A